MRLSYLFLVCNMIIVVTTSCKVSKDLSEGCKSEYDSISGQTIYTYVDQMPEFNNGINGIIEYFAKSFHYPEQESFQGSIQIVFIINEDGGIEYPRIIGKENDVISPAETEAIRVIEAMPQWQAGKCKGVNVKVKYILPINF